MLSRLVALTPLVALLAAGPAMPKAPPDWKEIDKLVSEQKVQAALDGAELRLKAAIAKKDEEDWTRALLKVTRLRMGLHGYETAVRVLRQQPWPKGPLQRATVGLYYAQALVTYGRMYSWEIQQREKVEAKGPVDLKAWTLEQIHAEAQRAYDEVWEQREALGTQKTVVLKEYITPTNYPPGIRDTLRDAVSYLRVELLADTSAWRPEHSNDLYRLDLKALVEGNPAASAKLKLSDPQVHPLVRLLAVLDDLEAWHAAGKRPEAALEARLERLRRLAASYTAEDERALLEQHLAARLPALKALPWSAMGKAELAELVRTRDLVKARAIAQEGATAFPDSKGGERCRSIVSAIEAPDYSLDAMSVDALGKKSLEVTHKNLAKLHFRAYPLDLEDTVTSARDYNLLPVGDELRKLLKTSPELSWTVALPATPDFQSHRTFVVPPLKRQGLYALMASVREDFAEPANRVLGVTFVASDLVLTSGTEPGVGLHVNVWSGSAGTPVPGAEVRLYEYDWRNRHTLLETKTSDANGAVQFAFGPKREGRSYFLFAKKGGDVTLDRSYSSFARKEQLGSQYGTLVYTDRSIYRPQQQVLWKTVVYQSSREGTRFEAKAQEALTVSLVDPNGEAVLTQKVTTNEFGSAAGEFTVPTGRLLGQWTVTSSRQGTASIRVEEYKRPTFEVTLKDPTAALRLNKPASLTGEARYYFGLPVVSAKVRWKVARVPVYPWWWGLWYGGSLTAGAQQIAAGTAGLAADGTFKIDFVPEADERRASKGVSYRYELSADVTDEGGETRSASRAFRLGWVAVEARVALDDTFLVAGEAGKATVSRTNLDGVPRAGAGTYRLLAVEQPAAPLLPADEPVLEEPAAAGSAPKVRTPGDAQRFRARPEYSWQAAVSRWKDGREVAKGALTHDAKGLAELSLKGLAPGLYRIRYQTQDEFGATFETQQELIVAGKGLTLALPALLLVQRNVVKAGQTARLLVHSALPGQRIILDLGRGGGRTERRYVHSGDAPVIELPVTEDDRGGFAVSAIAIRDHQGMPFADHVFVPWDNKLLQVSFSTFRDKIRPGAKETWRVTVKGATGQRETAPVELLAYMYDQALDLFGPHAPPEPASLYPVRNDWMWTRTNLGPLNGQWVTSASWPPIEGYAPLWGDRLLFLDGYGVGGPGRRRYYMDGPTGGAAEKEASPAESPAATSSPAPAPKVESSKLALMLPQRGAADAFASAPAAPATELRTNFSETAFWQPQLLLGPDGTATFEFKVPDSVTGWNVWAHAVTKDLRGGSVTLKTQSVKELMVRPYLPRFLREGDQAVLKVVVNNASARELSGNLKVELLDAETQQDLGALFKLAGGSKPFTVGKSGSASFELPITAPKEVRTVAVRAVATAGDLSDGELRPIPVLPSRMHLAQSKFVTLRNKDARELKFADLAKSDDPSRINEQLVVTVDAQLFYTVLQALPYLVNYPYECTEQTLNRFVSTGIVSSVFKRYPAVAKRAKQMSERQTPLETFDAVDPNRKMTVEESPWLVESRGGKDAGLGSVNVLDPRIAAAEREASLAKLRKAQTSLGAFPWFPGGPPSPYMTLYILHGLAKAAEFGVPVPKDMTQRAWQYVARHYRAEYAKRMLKDNCCWEDVTFINYVASSFPDASYSEGGVTMEERQQMLAHSFKHWKKHSPYLKGYLALTLKRMGREADAKLVFDSVMDSAKTTQDEGTFWAQEDRSWLWYNDTIESHAFALRTLMELKPTDPRRDGLVQWLLLNKKLSQWKSTRATAEVIYSLVKYLEKEGALGIREAAKITVGPKTVEMVFEPDVYTGKKNQVVVAGPEVTPQHSAISVSKETKGFLFASATWHFSTEKLPTEERGDLFHVKRTYFKRERQGSQTVLRPMAEGQQLVPGDELEIQLSIKSRAPAEYVHLRDPRAAGLEPENAVSRFRWDLGLAWYEETRDSGTNFFFEALPQGEYTLKYRLRVNMAGTFRVGPATLQSLYAPEFTAYSTGATLVVAPR